MKKFLIAAGVASILVVAGGTQRPANAQGALAATCVRFVLVNVAGALIQQCVQWATDNRGVWMRGLPPQQWQPYGGQSWRNPWPGQVYAPRRHW